MQIAVSGNANTKPSFQMLKLHNPEKWVPEFLDAVTNSTGIKKTAEKYDSFYVSAHKGGVLATADLAMHKVYYISLEPKNTKKTVQKIITFDSDKFDEWYSANAIQIPKTPSEPKKQSFIHRFLNFFR